MIGLLAVAAVLGLAALFWWECWGGKWSGWRLPPGPAPLPLFGTLHLVDRERPYLTIWEWGKKYGGLYTMWMGSRPSIVITDLELMKEVFVKAGYLFSERRIANPFTDTAGLIMANGDEWKHRRRLCTRHLRDLGMGKEAMEARIAALSDDLVARLRAKVGSDGAVLDPAPYLLHVATNILLSVVAGRKLSMEDPRYLDFHRCTRENFEKGMLLLVVPWLIHVPFLKSLAGWPACLQRLERTGEVLESLLDEARADLVANPADDSCLLYRLFREPSLGHQNLKFILSDFMIAGSETAANSLNFAMLYLVRWPEWEERLQAELAKELGPGTHIARHHRPRLPQLDAFLHETQRLGNILPIISSHAVGEDNAEVRGYKLPGGIPIHIEVSAVLSDPQHFPEPEAFKPERFLKKAEGGGWELGEIPDALCPFGLGKRSCIGEAVARAELFLVIGSLLQAFRIRPAEADKPPSILPVSGFSLSPKPYKARFIPK